MFVWLLHGTSLVLGLTVQSMTTPLLGAWLFSLLLFCLSSYKPQPPNPVWIAVLLWLVVLGASTFLISPVPGGASTMWCLAAMPMVALSVRREHMESIFKTAFVIVFLYALALIGQMMLHIRYTNFEYFIPWRDSYAVAWPMIDPNNASMVLNFGLITSFFLALKKPVYWVFTGYFILALIATASRMGALAGAVGCAILLIEHIGVTMTMMAGMFVAFPAIEILSSAFKTSLPARLEMWKEAYPLLWMRPWGGIGMGMFSFYYKQIRIEQATGGWYLHNDPYQIAIEMGLPALAVFVFLILMVGFTTTRKTLVSASVLLAVLLQSFMEFQYYVPAVSMLAGLALAYHRLHYGEKDGRLNPKRYAAY